MSRTRHLHVNAKRSCDHVETEIKKHVIPPKRSETQAARVLSRTRAVCFRDRLRLARWPFESRGDGSGWLTHGHGPHSVVARVRH
jgi:hypothetical protein